MDSDYRNNNSNLSNYLHSNLYLSGNQFLMRIVTYLLIILFTFTGLVGLVTNEIHLSAQSEVMPPDPVKVTFETEWNHYSWYQIPDWDYTTKTK